MKNLAISMISFTYLLIKKINVMLDMLLLILSTLMLSLNFIGNTMENVGADLTPKKCASLDMPECKEGNHWLIIIIHKKSRRIIDIFLFISHNVR